MSSFRALPLLLVLGLGCVPMKKFRELESNLADAGATVTVRDGRILELEEAVAVEQARVAGLEGRIAELEALPPAEEAEDAE